MKVLLLYIVVSYYSHTLDYIIVIIIEFYLQTFLLLINNTNVFVKKCLVKYQTGQVLCNQVSSCVHCNQVSSCNACLHYHICSYEECYKFFHNDRIRMYVKEEINIALN